MFDPLPRVGFGKKRGVESLSQQSNKLMLLSAGERDFCQLQYCGLVLNDFMY